MSATAVSNEIRCKWCRNLIIRRAAAPWLYECGRCKGSESSTGVVAMPRKPVRPGWALSRAS